MPQSSRSRQAICATENANSGRSIAKAAVILQAPLRYQQIHLESR